MNELKIGSVNFEKYDVTLRDGAQDPQARFSVETKLEIARRLDDFGFDHIEGGWSAANKKDKAFFRQARSLRLKHAKLVDFGSTAKPNTEVERDKNLLGLLQSETAVVTIVGKTWEQNVRNTLRVEWSENLKSITESLRFLADQGREVFFDAEHWFDGYRQNPDYAFEALDAALQGGASRLVLCDTRGANNDRFTQEAVESVVARFPGIKFGIHVHNDGDLGTINTIRALEAGVTHVQGTVNGRGERIGNVNWCSLLPTAEFKYGIGSGLDLTRLTPFAHAVAEVTGIPVPLNAAYVGYYAFAHKGGLHVNGQERDNEAYEHIRPEWVGNVRRYIHSEQGGSTNLEFMLRTYGFELSRKDPRFKDLVEKMKEYSNLGDVQALLFLHKNLEGKRMPFSVLDGSGIKEDVRGKPLRVGVNVRVNGVVYYAEATGDGPIDAYANALRQVLSEKYPEVNGVEFDGYKIEATGFSKRMHSTAAGVEAKITTTINGIEVTSIAHGTSQQRAGEQAFDDLLNCCILENGRNKAA